MKNIKRISLPGVTSAQDVECWINSDKIVATCITTDGDLIIKLDMVNDNEIICRYKDPEVAHNINKYLLDIEE